MKRKRNKSSAANGKKSLTKSASKRKNGPAPLSANERKSLESFGVVLR